MLTLKKIIRCLIIFSILTLIICQIGFSQSNTWVTPKLYPTGPGGFRDIEVTNNGGVIGVSRLEEVIRLNRYGDEIWYYDNNKNWGWSYDISDAVVIGNTVVIVGNNAGNNTIIAKIDSSGNLSWERVVAGFNASNSVEDGPLKEVAKSPSGNGYLLAGDTLSKLNPRKGFNVKLVHIDKKGNTTWQNELDIAEKTTISEMISFQSGNGYIICGKFDTVTTARYKFEYIARLDNNGDTIWTKSARKSHLPGGTIKRLNLEITNDGNFVVSHVFSAGLFGNSDTTYLMKLDPSGSLLWEKKFANIKVSDIAETNGGGLILATRDSADAARLIKTDKNGNQLWSKTFNGQVFRKTNCIHSSVQVEVNSNNHIYLTGRINKLIGPTTYDDFKYITKVDSNGNYLQNRIYGNIYLDKDSNCVRTPSDIGIANQYIYANGDISLHQLSDTNGIYNFKTTIDTYNVGFKPQPEYTNISPCATDTQRVHFNAPYQYDTVNFPLTTKIECPFLTVDLSVPGLRPCFSSRYSVDYCNYGTIQADSAYIEVTFDPYLHVDASSIPWQTPQTGNTYRFDVGMLSPGECNSFWIDVTTDCDSAVIGQTHCTQAHIYPDTLCLPDTSGWNGAKVAVDANCNNGDTVQFRVQNTGTGDMQDSLRYYIVEDNVMLRTLKFQLDSGQTLFDYEPSSGNTYRIEAEQVVNFPYESQPAAWTEGCGGFGTTGAVTDYYQNDGAPFLTTDCEQSSGSYDPNDKQVTPEGRGMDGTINQNRDLEYKIRFQNVGTDTAFRVVIRDTLSPHLDISTIQLGASSHNYQFQLRPNRVMEWEFPNIELPDSNVNEPASNGFVKFRVEQKDSLPIGTEIRNRAAIYFDFNDPVITNQTLNTIGKDYRKVVYVEEKSQDVEQIDVYPNPSRDRVTFDLKGQQYNQLKLRIFNISGQEVRSYGFHNTNRLTLDNLHLQQGTYLFEITSNEQKVGAGKLLVR